MVKRYWKSLLLVIVIFFTVGIFYVQAKVELTNLPNFTLATISGDIDELDLVNLDAYYNEGEKQRQLTISKEGSKYIPAPSYIGLLKGIYAGPIITDIEKRNRQFMRGKMVSHHNFFENDEWIAYVNMPWDDSVRSLDIDVLNKQTNKRNTFNFLLPASTQHTHVSLLDVHITNDQLFVLTQNAKNNVDFIMHRFNIQNEQQETFYNFHTLAKDLTDSQSSSYHFVDIPSRHLTEQDWIFFTDKKSDEINLMVFNYLTEEIEEIQLPEEVSENSLAVVDSHTVYFHEKNRNEINVVTYDYLQDEFTSLSFDPKGLADVGFHTEIIGDKIYMYNVEKSHHHKGYITVGSLTTGEVLYEGEIKVEGSEPTEKYHLSLSIAGDVLPYMSSNTIPFGTR